MSKVKFGKTLLSFILVSLLGACQSKSVSKITDTSTRSAASAVEDDEDSITKHEQTFIELMKDDDDQSRQERIKRFLDTQRSFFYIAHELMLGFDSRLDELYLKKQGGQKITAEEFQIFNEIRFKNLIAWEFSERNLHEMLDLYRLALTNAKNRKSPYHLKSQKILKQAEKWFQQGWDEGDRSAIIMLAQEFEDVNQDVFPKKAPAWVPQFKKYMTLSDEELKQAYAQSDEYAKSRKLMPIDHFIEKKWNDHLENRKQGLSDLFTQLYDARTPQALDDLEPDAGPKGHVTGNRFPQGGWAFTFDDGPHPVYTLGMFDNLQKTGVGGTFFWLTQNLVKYPELAKKAGEYGYSRACHSYTHANLPTLKPAALNHEINEAIDGFTKIVGQPPTMYRCPYGACGGNGSNIRQLIAGHHALEIFWNVDTLDWQDKNPQSVFERAKKQVDMMGRGIILFHDIHPQSVIASKMLIEYIKSNPKLKISLLKDLIGESRGKAYSSP